MKKNIRDYKVNGKQFSYILDSINVTDYEGNDIENVSDKDRVRYFFKCFENEYNTPYLKSIYPNLKQRISQYIQGLPSCINIDFYNYKIVEIGKNWGYCKTKRQEVEFIENWFSVIASRLIKLREYFNL